MKKKADWPIENCWECNYLKYSPNRDAICTKALKYLWLNIGTSLDGKQKPLYRYMPEWCPLENYIKVDNV